MQRGVSGQERPGPGARWRTAAAVWLAALAVGLPLAGVLHVFARDGAPLPVDNVRAAIGLDRTSVV